MSGELSQQVKICFLGSTLPPGQISAIFPPVWLGLWLPPRWYFLQPVKSLWALCSASTITLICLWYQGVRCKCGYYPQDKSRLRKYLIRYKNICHQQLIWQLWPFENLKSKQFPYDEKVKLGNIWELPFQSETSALKPWCFHLHRSQTAWTPFKE